MDKLWYYILIFGGPISLIVAYIGFGKDIVKFFNWIFRKEDREKKICIKILEWFAYIDKNLTDKSIELQELDHIEKEIDFQFSMKKNSKYILKFSNRFIDKYLKFIGIQKKYRSKENFIKCAPFKHENLEVILGLESHVQKTKFTHLKMPFRTYWNLIRGNFYIFHQQYINDWKGIKEEQKVTFSDVEMPIKLLRMYFKIF